MPTAFDEQPHAAVRNQFRISSLAPWAILSLQSPNSSAGGGCRVVADAMAQQDDLASRIVESFSLPLTTREHGMLKHDVPASAKAHEFYLRANQLATSYPKASVARALYLECLQEDPAFTKTLRHAEARHREARAALLQADGDRLLGLTVSR